MNTGIKNFSFAEMTSNSTGKTSGSGAMGVYIVIMSVLAFLYGCVEFHYSGKADIMMYSSANILVGAGLLGYRKSQDTSMKGIVNQADPDAELKKKWKDSGGELSFDEWKAQQPQ